VSLSVRVPGMLPGAPDSNGGSAAEEEEAEEEAEAMGAAAEAEAAAETRGRAAAAAAAAAVREERATRRVRREKCSICRCPTRGLGAGVRAGGELGLRASLAAGE